MRAGAACGGRAHTTAPRISGSEPPKPASSHEPDSLVTLASYSLSANCRAVRSGGRCACMRVPLALRGARVGAGSREATLGARCIAHLHRAQPLDGLRGWQPQRARRAQLLHVLQRRAWGHGRPRRPGLLGRSVLHEAARPGSIGHRQTRQIFRRAVLEHERSGSAREGGGHQRHLRAGSEAWEQAALALAEEVGERRAQHQLGEHAWRRHTAHGGRLELDQFAAQKVPGRGRHVCEGTRKLTV